MPTHPPLEYLRECFRHEDGRLYWLVRPREHFATKRAWNAWNAKFPGKEAGHSSVNCVNGYKSWVITLKNKHYGRDSVCWCLVYGEWISGLDHKNRDSLNDRIDNLRPATQAQNLANGSIRSDNRSGIRGVSWDSQRQRWQVHVSFGGKHIALGRYKDLEEAQSVYLEAAKKHHGEFASDGISSVFPA